MNAALVPFVRPPLTPGQSLGPARGNPDRDQEHDADRHGQADEDRKSAILTRMGSGAAPPARGPSANGFVIARQRDPKPRGWPAGGFVIRAKGRETRIEVANLVARAPTVDVGL